MSKDGKKLDLFSLFYKNSLLVEGIIIFAIFQIMSGGLYLSVGNVTNILMQGAVYAIISITMCLVIITGNADLSAGRFLGLLGMMAAMILVNNQNMSPLLTMVIVYAVAIVAGLWHGFWVGYMKLPAFIITLTTQLIFQGISQFISGGRIYGPVRGIVKAMGSGYLPTFTEGVNDTTLIFGAVLMVAYVWMTVAKERKAIKQGLASARWGQVIPKMVAICAGIIIITGILFQHKGYSIAMIVMLILTVVVSYISNNTKFGRYIYAIGGNKDAAALSGINVPKELVKMYVLHAVIVATAAMVCLGRLNSATAAAGQGYEFTAITGCVVGGVAITGGRGTVVGAVVGTLIMAALDNGMSIMNFDPSLQYVVRGAVLLFAIAMDKYANDRKAKTVQAA